MICKKCNTNFPSSMKIDGKLKILSSRKYCLDCSPYKEHNTRKLEISLEIPDYKICPQCKENKSKRKYHSRTDRKGLAYYCKKCANSNAWKKQYKQGLIRKLKLIKLFDSKCQKCDYNKNIASLAFHHTRDKKFTLDVRNIANRNLDSIKEEVKKCILLCHNCHMETHYPHLDMKYSKDFQNCLPPSFKKTNYSTLERELGASDNAIREHLKKKYPNVG